MFYENRALNWGRFWPQGHLAQSDTFWFVPDEEGVLLVFGRSRPPVSSFQKRVLVMPHAGPCNPSHGCPVWLLSLGLWPHSSMQWGNSRQTFCWFWFGVYFCVLFSGCEFCTTWIQVSQAWHSFGPHSFCPGAGPVHCRMCSSISGLYVVGVSGTCATVFPVEEEVNFSLFLRCNS